MLIYPQSGYRRRSDVKHGDIGGIFTIAFNVTIEIIFLLKIHCCIDLQLTRKYTAYREIEVTDKKNQCRVFEKTSVLWSPELKIEIFEIMAAYHLCSSNQQETNQ